MVRVDVWVGGGAGVEGGRVRVGKGKVGYGWVG